jgi:hypothetical protein
MCHVWGQTSAKRVSVEKPEGKRPFGRPRREEYNIKIDFHQICAKLWPRSGMHTWVPSFWSQGILRISVWEPSGALVKRQGSHKMLSGHKGPVYLRPRCIGAVGPRPVYLSTFIKYGRVELINLAQERKKWRAPVNAVILTSVFY